jgi:hypothetical protein
MTTGAMVFMALAWVFVLGLLGYTWAKLLSGDPKKEHLPPPGTSL